MWPNFRADEASSFKELKDQKQAALSLAEPDSTVGDVKFLSRQGRAQSQGMNRLNFSPALRPDADNKETLETTIASAGKEGADAKNSIMVVFNSKKQQEQERPLPLPLPPDVPLEAGATPLRVGGPGHTWYSSVRTAPPSSGTGKGSRTGTGSVGGAERYGYLSFSEVQVDDDELQQEEESDEMRSWGSYSSHADSFRSSREMLQRRLRKRARAWRVFLAVMQEHGLRVRKYHRRGKGWAHRVVKYDSSLPGLRWKSNKWWDAGGGQIPLRDVLDVERRSKVVWIKCLHLGTVGFEASLETDAVIFYLAMDSLLDRRCGVDDSSRERRLTGSMFA